MVACYGDDVTPACNGNYGEPVAKSQRPFWEPDVGGSKGSSGRGKFQIIQLNPLGLHEGRSESGTLWESSLSTRSWNRLWALCVTYAFSDPHDHTVIPSDRGGRYGSEASCSRGGNEA